jgi:ABC-type transport system involved in multi-copper enzyme maturation permease subunit
MWSGLAPLAGLATADLRRLRDRSARKAAFLAVIVLFALLAFGFGLTALTVALARWLGLLGALLLMMGACIAGLLITLILMRLAEARDREIDAKYATRNRRLYQMASLAILPSVLRPGRARLAGRAVGLGLMAAGGLLLFARRRRRDDD